MRQELRATVALIVGCILLLWGIEIVNVFLGHALSRWGILPRTVSGLIGIPFSPLLHASIGHLMVNTLPFAILGGLVALHGRQTFVLVSLWIMVVGGVGLWLFGRFSYHVGASSLIFGYFGYLVARGWYERSVWAIIVALVTLSLYGSILWGTLPTRCAISWEGHLSGLLAGILAARLWHPRQSTSVSYRA
jgi:membrane associated rhomboid family serine protease